MRRHQSAQVDLVCVAEAVRCGEQRLAGVPQRQTPAEGNPPSALAPVVATAGGFLRKR